MFNKNLLCSKLYFAEKNLLFARLTRVEVYLMLRRDQDSRLNNTERSIVIFSKPFNKSNSPNDSRQMNTAKLFVSDKASSLVVVRQGGYFQPRTLLVPHSLSLFLPILPCLSFYAFISLLSCSPSLSSWPRARENPQSE